MPLKSKSTSASPSPALLAVAVAPKAKESSSEPLDQNSSRKPPPPMLKFEVPSLSDVNLATIICSGAVPPTLALRTSELRKLMLLQVAVPSRQWPLSPVCTDSPFFACTKVASSEEGQTESKVGKRGEDESDDESQDPFDADAQLLVPGLSPTPPTNSTFVFPPPDVSHLHALTVPLPPAPVSPTSPCSLYPPQLSPSLASKRKPILQLVRTVKRGVGSDKKNATANDLGSPHPNRAPRGQKQFPPLARARNDQGQDRVRSLLDRLLIQGIGLLYLSLIVHPGAVGAI